MDAQSVSRREEEGREITVAGRDEIKSNYLDIIGLIAGLREIIEGASRSLRNFPTASRVASACD